MDFTSPAGSLTNGPAPTPLMLPIPGGTIHMRDARSATVREAVLLPFGISATHITSAQWTRAGDTTGSNSQLPGTPAHPITWLEAVRWCNRISVSEGLSPAYSLEATHVGWDVSSDGYRLPTEAEWEWACRAGTTGPTYGELADIAWTDADQLEGPQPVALKKPNNFGLFDMIGNLWEWCWDYADTSRYGDYRSLRGGGWADAPWSCRASVRRGSAPDAVVDDIGFRVVRGSVGEPGQTQAQGWSAMIDQQRADIRGPLPMGWTPLRSLLDR